MNKVTLEHKKFNEVFKYVKSIHKDTFQNVEKYELKIAMKFNGHIENTGGNCLVVYIPINNFYCIGVNEEYVILYKFSKEMTIQEWLMSEDCGENLGCRMKEVYL